ncbi:DUF3558 domain-containing protein [Nocardia sp. CDC159]|uniref:DUF3558 domain-containing protein n=1 Tax=Nocardia pulmonis TaxID=2951408 RepID=A0A9X2IZW9_9NOCA|nr:MULTISPECIES: DUF3558 family protein [Nocardia]MCM6777848.1 DUF3558 domain-containing protein [Nocardia pulmonis]MCM6790732.1 DUF3558 domain-containing protein [Nocardia sp. CDC159]
MSKRLVIAVAAVAVAAVAGCAGPDGGPTPVATSSPVQAAGEALSIGECGAASDADIAAAIGSTRARQTVRNPMRCRWEAADGSAVTFAWFRGSPIEGRTPSGAGDRVSRVRLGGHTGKLWPADGFCEIAVGSGASDFIDWRIDTAPGAGAQACSAARRLATGTLDRAE